jgi:nicotinate dehydrogenase subunit A
LIAQPAIECDTRRIDSTVNGSDPAPVAAKPRPRAIADTRRASTARQSRSKMPSGAETCVMAVSLKVNGTVHSVTAEPDTPLLYVLRNDLGLIAAKFGCGLGQCGACTVLVDGAPMHSCTAPIGTLGQSEITTLEGLGTLERPHPLQSAFIAEQAVQCGYCIPGMIMLAKALLDRKPQPSEAEVRLGLAGNLCRCGTHNRIVRAVLRASQASGRI